MTKHKVYIIDWYESERGWGQRPDGVSLHLSQEDINIYIENYWLEECSDQDDDYIPDEYSAPSTYNGTIIEVSEEIYRKILDLNKRNIYGLRIWQHELQKFNIK